MLNIKKRTNVREDRRTGETGTTLLARTSRLFFSLAFVDPM